MMWAVYLQQLRRRRISWLIYAAIGLGFLVLYLATFPVVQQQQASYNEILKTVPKGVLEAFNISNSSTSLMGYLAAKHYGLTWEIMLILLTTAFAGGAIAREVNDRTMGLLLALPISRLKLYVSRVAAGITGLVIFILMSVTIIGPLAAAFGYAAPAADIWRLSVVAFCFGFAVLGIGLGFSAIFSDAGSVYAAVGGTLFAMYILNIIALLQSNLVQLKYLSLFHYFTPGDLIDGGHIHPASVLVYLAVGLVTIALGALVFNRRDVSV